MPHNKYEAVKMLLAVSHKSQVLKLRIDSTLQHCNSCRALGILLVINDDTADNEAGDDNGDGEYQWLLAYDRAVSAQQEATKAFDSGLTMDFGFRSMYRDATVVN
jgi:hypothetical protein